MVSCGECGLTTRSTGPAGTAFYLASVGGGGPVNLVLLGADQVRHGASGPDPRETPPRGLRTRDVYIPDLHIDSIKVKTRDFR